MKALWLLVLVTCALLSIPAQLRAQPLFNSTDSIESTVANADAVVVGTRVELGSGSDVLVVETTLKGEHHEHVRVGLHGSATKVEKGHAPRLLVALKGDPPFATRIIDLSSKELAVLTRDFTLLSKSEDVVRAANEAVRRMPGVRQIETFRLVVPRQVVIGVPHWDQYYQTGGYITAEVPVDDHLEKRAQECIRSDGYTNREEGVRALRYFPSDENQARARSLLNDPGWAYMRHAEENRGVEVRIYGVREEAYRTLRYWGVQAQKPMIREEIVKLDRLQLVDLSNTTVTLANLEELAPFKNLEDLYLRNVTLTDATLKRVSEFASLRKLDLSGTTITDAGLKQVAALARLQYLGLRGTKLTGSSIGELAHVKSLTSLDLSQTNVTDEALRDIAGLSSLRDVDLSESKVSAGGIDELRKRRPDLKVTR